jgi:hypothetical protein
VFNQPEEITCEVNLPGKIDLTAMFEKLQDIGKYHVIVEKLKNDSRLFSVIIGMFRTTFELTKENQIPQPDRTCKKIESKDVSESEHWIQLNQG